MSARLSEREAPLDWVSIETMVVPMTAQRAYRPAWAAKLANEFDPDKLGLFTVNVRDGQNRLIDGQHRKGMLEILGYTGEKVQSRVYRDLTDAQEADTFLRLNNRLTVNGFDRFRVSVTAGRTAESEVAAVVADVGLVVSEQKTAGAVGCIVTLVKVHRRGGAELLRRTLVIIRDAWGDVGLIAPVIDGVSAVLWRYGDRIRDDVLTTRLAGMRGGIGGMLSKAEVLVRATSKPRWQCVAAVCVDQLNEGRGGKKLPTWWKPSDARRSDAKDVA
jgi:hypothetical protein